MTLRSQLLAIGQERVRLRSNKHQVNSIFLVEDDDGYSITKAGDSATRAVTRQ